MTTENRAAAGDREVVRGLRVFGFVDARRLGLTVKPMTLDGQNLSFTATVTDFNKPAMTFELTADTINADRYMAAGTADKTQAQPAKEPAARQPQADWFSTHPDTVGRAQRMKAGQAPDCG